MNIVGIDFEFINLTEKNICSVGIAHPDKNVFYTLVKPPEDAFWDPLCSGIHKITPKMVKNAPTLEEVWDSMLDYIGDAILIAHCAKGVERNVILKNAAAHNLVHPRFKMCCSMVLSRRALPGLYSYSLPIVAEFLKISFQHHHAGEDAHTCLQVARHCFATLGMEYCQPLFFYIDDPTKAKRPHKQREDDFQTIVNTLPKSANQLEGLSFAFTGTLPIKREKAVFLVRQYGGLASDKGGLSKDTNFLVMGDNEYTNYHNGIFEHKKAMKVKELLDEGKEIGILNYQDYLEIFI